MSHKLDSVFDPDGELDSVFVKGSVGERWGVVETFNHEYGESKCVFESDEEGTYLRLTMLYELGDNQVKPDVVYEALNFMNGAQADAQLHFQPKNRNLIAKRILLVKGHPDELIREMIAEVFPELCDIFDDAIFAVGVHESGAAIEQLADVMIERDKQRRIDRLRKKNGNWDDPAYA